MTAKPRTCVSARGSVLALSDLLRRHELASWRMASDTIDDCFSPCKQCSGKKGKSWKKCTGWKFDFRDRYALNFTQAEVHGRFYNVSITARHDCSRKQGESWENYPMAACNPAVEVWDMNDELVTRQHVDLADPGQPGPVWHLQLGGLPSKRQTKPEYEHLDVPRWPCIPLDFVMVTEIVLQSFFPKQWRDLSELPEWLDLVAKSERHMLKSYVDWLLRYWDQQSSRNTWLREQCNQTGSWNPRPAR